MGKFTPERRSATLAALALEGTATVTDELIDLHDRILIKLFATAKNKHQEQFQTQGKAINDQVRLVSQESPVFRPGRVSTLRKAQQDGIYWL